MQCCLLRARFRSDTAPEFVKQLYSAYGDSAITTSGTFVRLRERSRLYGTVINDGTSSALIS